MKNLFAYGSLMCDEIITDVAGFHPQSAKARLSGYRRLSVKGQLYPAAIVDSDAEVEGMLFLNLAEDTWQQLDYFEGDMYRRDKVNVVTADGCQYAAEVYVAKEKYHHYLSDSPWDYEQFLKRYKGKFK